MAQYPFYHIDAFANQALKGNPAAIIPVDAFLPTEQMQAIAAENNIAETSFIVSKGNGIWDLRWFTPAVEVPLCGHATLAAAHAIFEHEGYTGDEIGFDTKSGRLTVSRLADNRLEMDFPANMPVKSAPTDEMIAALGKSPVEVWQGNYIAAIFESSDDIIKLAPDFSALEVFAGKPNDIKKWLICVAPAKGTFAAEGYDIVSRFFAPGSGANEDPATGSAHCILAPLFSKKLNKAELKCFQAFPGRGADIGTRMSGDRVKLMGHAVTVIEGTFSI